MLVKEEEENEDERAKVPTGLIIDGRTIDLLRHIKNASYLDPQIVKLAKDAFELMDKEPVREIV